MIIQQNMAYVIGNITCYWNTSKVIYRIVGVMVSVLVSRVVDRGFERRSVHTKDYEIGSFCFSGKHAALRSKSKYWLDRNQNIVSKWSDKFTRVLLFRWASANKIQLIVAV